MFKEFAARLPRFTQRPFIKTHHVPPVPTKEANLIEKLAESERKAIAEQERRRTEGAEAAAVQAQNAQERALIAAERAQERAEYAVTIAQSRAETEAANKALAAEQALIAEQKARLAREVDVAQNLAQQEQEAAAAALLAKRQQVERNVADAKAKKAEADRMKNVTYYIGRKADKLVSAKFYKNCVPHFYKHFGPVFVAELPGQKAAVEGFFLSEKKGVALTSAELLLAEKLACMLLDMEFLNNSLKPAEQEAFRREYDEGVALLDTELSVTHNLVQYVDNTAALCARLLNNHAPKR